MKLIKKTIIESKIIGNIELQEGDIIYVPMREDDTKDIKVVNPDIQNLPKNAWNEWSIEKLASHFVSLAKDKGREEVSKSIMNIERWNSEKNPDLSKKARSVFEKYKSQLEK